MNWDFWKKTHQIKPFNSLEEWDSYVEDSLKLPNLDLAINSPMKKSKVKKGIDIMSNKYDSFAEYTLFQYMRLIKGYVVERNKSQYLHYIDLKGKMRKYYYDFTINGAPAEVKGRITDNDRCKLEQCTNVTWYFQSDINIMAAELNKQFPGWKEDFTQTN
jgi:hypothetical protein